MTSTSSSRGEHVVQQRGGRAASPANDPVHAGDVPSNRPPGPSDSPGVVIRRFSLSRDYDDVIDLWRRSGLDIGPSETREGIAKKLERDPHLFLVAEREGRIVGAIMGTNDGRRGYFYRLAVDRSERRHGIGTALVREVERLLRRDGVVKVNAIVKADNAAALEFYERLGYDHPALTVVSRRLT